MYQALPRLAAPWFTALVSTVAAGCFIPLEDQASAPRSAGTLSVFDETQLVLSGFEGPNQHIRVSTGAGRLLIEGDLSAAYGQPLRLQTLQTDTVLRLEVVHPGGPSTTYLVDIDGDRQAFVEREVRP